MANISNIQVTIAIQDLGLNDQELQAEVENLLPQLREVDGVQQADLVAVTAVPQGAKAWGGFLLGVLNAEVNPANIKAVFQFLGDRLSNKTIELEVEANGKKLSVKASSQEELRAALKAAQEFLNS